MTPHPRRALSIVAVCSCLAVLFRARAPSSADGALQQGAAQGITLSGAVSDAVGDSIPRSQAGMRMPDLQAGTVQVSGGNLVITISFAEGTLAPQTGLTVYLDTDEDAATGSIALRERDPIGADYAIRGLTPHDPSKASITQEAAQNQSRFRGIVDVTSLTSNQRRIVVPLTRLGNDDGRLRFKVECYQVIASSRAGQTATETILSHVDAMPDNGRPPGVVR